MLLVIAAVFAPAMQVPARSLLSTIVNDPLTGVAMDGYDPVSFFTESSPKAGRAEFEYLWAGLPWYFASAANRDAFSRAPEIYAPQFGGHDPMGLSRGYLSDGDPRLYAVLADRLFLFYSTGNRDAFLMDPRPAFTRAQGTWAALAPQLVND